MNPPSPDHSFLSSLRPHAGLITGACTSLVFIAGMIFNYSGQNQHSKDVQATQGQQIEDNRKDLNNLQLQVNKDDVLLAVIEQFKGETTKKLDRIEGLLLQDLHGGKPPQLQPR
jgi:uncharacterized protein (DUF2225 family)